MKSLLVGLKCFVVAGFVCSTSIFCGNLSTPFLNLVEKGSVGQIVDLLQNQYGNVNDTIPDACVQDLISAVDQAGKTSLHYAVRSGDGKKIRLLLRLCIPLLDQVDNAGWSPLVEAIELSSFVIAKLLLKYGARVNRGTQRGETPLAVLVRLQKAGESKELDNIAKLLGEREAPSRPIPDELWSLGARDDSYTSSSDDSSEHDLGFSIKEGLPRSSSCPARLSDLVQPLKKIHRSPECNFVNVAVALPITPTMSRNSSFKELQEAVALSCVAKKALADKNKKSLQQALFDGRYEDASQMIKTGKRALKFSHMVFVNTIDSKLGCLPLTHAVFMQDYDQVEYLLGLGASINEVDPL